MYIYVSEPNKIGYLLNKKTPILNTCSPTTILLASRSFWVIIVRYRPVTSTSSQVIFVLCWHKLFASGENYENNN